MQYNKAWPTTIGKGNFDSLDLSQHILTNYDLNNLKGEVGGFNMFNDKSTQVKNFKKIAYDAFDQYLYDIIGKHISDYKSYEMKTWITGHGKDYSMTIHNHAGAHLSGVFYVLAEDQHAGGDIVFTDPRSNANRGYDDWFDPMFKRISCTPKTGEYMIFPSFAYHHVNPYYSILRICCPVDLYLYRN